MSRYRTTRVPSRRALGGSNSTPASCASRMTRPTLARLQEGIEAGAITGDVSLAVAVGLSL
jgi:hypothetical protein